MGNGVWMSVCPVNKTHPYSHFPPPQNRSLTHSQTHAQILKVFPMTFRMLLFHVFESWGHTIVGEGLRPSHISKEINLFKPQRKSPEKFRTGCRDSPGCLSHHAEPGRTYKAFSFLFIFFFLSPSFPVPSSF